MLTRLKIINAMLASTGIAPLTTNDEQHPFYQKANNKITEVLQKKLSYGWWFNTTERVAKADTSGQITLPDTVLHADSLDTPGVVLRGNRLYNSLEATYVVGKDVLVKYVEYLDIPELPTTAATYIKERCVYEYYRDQNGTGAKLGEYKEAAYEAEAGMKRENLKNLDINWRNSAVALELARPRSRRAARLGGRYV